MNNQSVMVSNDEDKRIVLKAYKEELYEGVNNNEDTYISAK